MMSAAGNTLSCEVLKQLIWRTARKKVGASYLDYCLQEICRQLPISSFCGKYHIHKIWFEKFLTLEDMAHYAGLLLAPVEGFGLRPRVFLPFGQKRELIMLFWPIFGNFWPVVTFVTFLVTLVTLKGIPRKTRKIQKNIKNFKKRLEILKKKFLKLKNPQQIKKSKNPKNIQEKSKTSQKIFKNSKNLLKKNTKNLKNVKNCQKKSKNHKKSQKITFFCQKNAILLVFQY